MLPLKRKRHEVDDVELESDSNVTSERSSGSSVADMDLLGKNNFSQRGLGKVSSNKKEAKSELESSSEDEEGETALIRESITKRNIREGKEILKKTSKAKGKGKAKDEMGGGSFQSMGLSISYRDPEPTTDVV